MKVTVIIVNYNVRYFLEVCLHSVLRALTGIDGEVIVVDNNSTDDSNAMVREQFPSVILIDNKDNKGFSKANNQGVAIARGEYILFLNPDTVLPEDFFQKTIAYMDAHPEAGCIGPRLLDGKGQYAPESKRSFPSLPVAIFKTTGINKLFSKSPFFNRYYAVHIGRDATAPVDVLMGCSMMMRAGILKDIGGYAFDEDFFMYGEDIDLSYRIQKAGYHNIYFPETSIIHYKGESTKKATLSYVRIFNEALSLFVKKNYTKANARLFNGFINVGIILRAIITLVKNVLSIIKMPLLDTLILLATFWLIKELYLEDVRQYRPLPVNSLLATIPVYLGLWILNMFLNGVYEQSYNPLRVIRGMAIGTVLILAYYGLLPTHLRYSRSIIVFTAFGGTALMLAAHQVLYHFKIFNYIPYNTISKKTLIVAGNEHYADTRKLMQSTHYPLELFGQVAVSDSKDTLTNVRQLNELMYLANINEVVFCPEDISYKDIISQMQLCGKDYEYKIHLSGSLGFVGSNSRHTSGDVYSSAPKYKLSHSYHIRNKRILDICSSIFFLLLSPVLILLVKNPGGFLSNAWRTLIGRTTWVGYSLSTPGLKLPAVRPSVLPTYNMLKDNNAIISDPVKQQLDIAYATNYSVTTDIKMILKNFRYLGLRKT